jgi:hypothetical protein
VFQVRIELAYNEDGKTVMFDDFLIASTPAARVLANLPKTGTILPSMNMETRPA